MPKSGFFCLVFLLFQGLIAFPAIAAMTDWQDIGGGKARLIGTVDPQTEAFEGALEVRLKDGWSTYWRYPGSSGIPPQFDFSGSVGYQHLSVQFPAPSMQGKGKNAYAGYKKSVSFPISGKLSLALNSSVHLDLLIGVCEEVCIPAKAKFTLTKQNLSGSSPVVATMVNLAKTQVPKPMPTSEMLTGKEMGSKKELHISVAHEKTEAAKPELFIEGPQNWYLLPAKLMETDENGSVFSLSVSSAPDNSNYLSAPLRYTLVVNGKGYEFAD